MPRIPVSIGVFCHNEEKNIAKTIKSILTSKIKLARIIEIIIVSSGSFDNTNKVIKELIKQDKRIKFIQELERSGKSTSVNLFLFHAKGKVLISLGGDLKVHPNAIEEIIAPFVFPEVGMAGAHPVPLYLHHSQIGKEIALLWELHHQISLVKPKCGEMVAFRNVIRQIPKESAVDEASLEVLLKIIGFTVVYCPKSIVYNQAPKTITDYIIQRRRVQSGHLWLQNHYHYQVVTLDYQKIISVIISHLFNYPQSAKILMHLIILEIYCRLLGWFDYRVLHKNPYIWPMVKR